MFAVVNQDFVFLLKVIKNGSVVNFLADAVSCHKIKIVFIFTNVHHTVMCCECVSVCTWKNSSPPINLVNYRIIAGNFRGRKPSRIS